MVHPTPMDTYTLHLYTNIDIIGLNCRTLIQVACSPSYVAVSDNENIRETVTKRHERCAAILLVKSHNRAHAHCGIKCVGGAYVYALLCM